MLHAMTKPIQLRPTSEGFDKRRNVRILTLADVEYDWPERLVYITQAALRNNRKYGRKLT